MAFWFWKKPCGARPGLWPWNQCKKSASAGEWVYIGCLPKGKTEIPAKFTTLRTEVRPKIELTEFLAV
jgi:hypothetical protein